MLVRSLRSLSIRPIAPTVAPGTAVLLLLMTLSTTSGCSAPPPADGSGAGAPIPEAAEWEVLFDGTDLDQWKGYGREDVPDGWRIADDGSLHFAPGHEGGDLVTREAFGDFELALEWKVAPCANSGILYRGGETAEALWETAPEMQILDDDCHADARFPSHRAGANYDLYMATPGVVRPAEEWNEVRIVARGPHVEHWLNGQKVVEYEQGSPAWQARVAASKFRTMPGYGTLMAGVIGLQDHGDPVWYRDIRIRRLG
jgi:hypothetical protein